MLTVDVIVPCYNYGHFLRECVGSVLSQKGVQVRVLVIDDCSTDDSAEIAASLIDPRVTLHRHENNRGHIATYNEGLDWASADFLLVLSADDYLLPGSLQRSTGLMNAQPQMAFTFGAVLALNSITGETREIRTIPSECDRVFTGLEFIRQSGADNLVLTPTAVVRTDYQKKVGHYLKELPHSADMEMWLRLAAHGDVGYIRTPQAVYRRHATNMDWAYGAFEDLLQRELALDYFFTRCHSMLPSRIEHNIRFLLAKSAIKNASMAWDKRNRELEKALVRYAHTIDPNVWRSLAWAKFRLKQVAHYCGLMQTTMVS